MKDSLTIVYEASLEGTSELSKSVLSLFLSALFKVEEPFLDLGGDRLVQLDDIFLSCGNITCSSSLRFDGCICLILKFGLLPYYSYKFT